jgi:transcriptional regulator with XRE-family HTH domain
MSRILDIMAEWFKELGQQIEVARQKANLTQQQLGDQVGLSRQTIIAYESGTAKKLSFETILELTRILEAPFTIYGCVISLETLQNGHKPRPETGQLSFVFDQERIFEGATLKIRASRTGILITAEAKTA